MHVSDGTGDHYEFSGRTLWSSCGFDNKWSIDAQPCVLLHAKVFKVFIERHLFTHFPVSYCICVTSHVLYVQRMLKVTTALSITILTINSVL